MNRPKRHDSGPTHAALTRSHLEAVEASLLTARCVFCAWTWDGTLADARAAAVAHREAKHPNLKPPARRGSRKLAHRHGTEEERREASLLRQAALAEKEPHGTRGRYAHGCTCLPCSDAWRIYHDSQGAA